MAMTTMPSAVKGNLQTNSERIPHRAPKFQKHLKSSRNVHLKPLQVERRFSHYEQKIANAPIERCNTKMPRRLQTRKVSRQIKPAYDDERIKWNERLAAWLREDQSSTVEYIKFTDQFNIIEKHLYYCSACHEFFHLNLKEMENGKGCPRHGNRHGNYVRPVSVNKMRKPRKQPTVPPKNPFGDRSNLKIPSLLPPKPGKRRVLVDVPPLPPIPKSPRKKVTLPPPLPSLTPSKKHFPSPATTTPTFSPIVVNDDPVPSPSKIESIYKTPSPPAPTRDTKPELSSPKPQTPPLRQQEVPKTVKENIVVPQQQPSPIEDSEESPVPPPKTAQFDDCEEEGRNSEKINVVSFNRHELNDIYECSDVESIQHEAELDVEDDFGNSGSVQEEDSDAPIAFDDPEVEAEIQISSPESQEMPSPARNRPKPPPPDLPDLDFAETPDSPPVKKKQAQLKRRKAMILSPVKQVQKPKPKTPEEDTKIPRMTSEELARRMRKAKEINGYRKKYAFNEETEPDSDDQSDDLNRGNLDIYDNSFLEKYCLVSSKQLGACKKVFKEFDQDNDGLLKTEEVVNAIHKMFSPAVIEDGEMCYIFRILETTSFDMFSDRMNLKLFAIVASLAQRISELDAYMKHLIGRVNTEVVDWKLHQARSLFEYTMRKDMSGTYKVPMEAIWIELHAGGVSEEHERQARKSLSHLKEMDLLDFLTYLPLFLLLHSNVVDNPLNADRNV